VNVHTSFITGAVLISARAHIYSRCGASGFVFLDTNDDGRGQQQQRRWLRLQHTLRSQNGRSATKRFSEPQTEEQKVRDYRLTACVRGTIIL